MSRHSNNTDVFGSRSDSFFHACPEMDLIIAAYEDDVGAVKNILDKNPHIDVNKKCIRGARGNGSALVLTGSVEIAALLLARGADINLENGRSEKYTALDSAYRELTKLPVRKSAEKTAKINELITFLRAHGGLKYAELCERSVTQAGFQKF